MSKIKVLWLIITLGLLFSFVGSAFAKPIDIQWWHAMRGARGKVVQTIVDNFNNSQTDYRVVATYKGAYDEVVNAGVAAVRARKQPHILQSFEVGTQIMMMSGAIYPVHELMADKAYKVDWSQYLQPVLSYYMNADGNLMSMPFNSSTPVMYYNVDLFKKAGIPMLSKENPITWDELGEITGKLVKSVANVIIKNRSHYEVLRWIRRLTAAELAWSCSRTRVTRSGSHGRPTDRSRSNFRPPTPVTTVWPWVTKHCLRAATSSSIHMKRTWRSWSA